MEKRNVVICVVLSLVMALSLALPLLAMQTPDEISNYTAVHYVADAHTRCTRCCTQKTDSGFVYVGGGLYIRLPEGIAKEDILSMSSAIFENEAAFRLVEHKLDEIMVPNESVQVFVTEMEDGTIDINTQSIGEHNVGAFSWCRWGNPSSFWVQMEYFVERPPTGNWSRYAFDTIRWISGCQYRGRMDLLSVQNHPLSPGAFLWLHGGTIWHTLCG